MVVGEGGVGGPVDAGGAGRGDAEEVFDIGAGGFGDGDGFFGAGEAAAVLEAASPVTPAGGVVKHEGAKVVNGHDIGPGQHEGDDVERDVDQVGTQSAGEHGEGDLIERR